MTILSRLSRLLGKRPPESTRPSLPAPVDPGDNEAVLARMLALCAQRPIGLSVEGISVCNSRCVFCAYPKLRRGRTVLDMALFARLAADHAALGGGFLGFSPFMADPLLDPHLWDRLDLLEKNHPATTPHLFTNAIAMETLDDAKVDRLLAVMDHIDVSLGGLERERYRRMFGVDRFPQVWRSLERLARRKRETGSSCQLQAHLRTFDKKAELESEAFRVLTQDWGFACTDVIDSFANWGGLVTQADMPDGATVRGDNDRLRPEPCLIPMIYMTVLPDGQVLACGCMDAKEPIRVGDLNRQSLAEIWHGPARREFLDSFAREAYHSVCRCCSFYTPASDILANPGLADYTPAKNIWKSLR